MSGAVNAILNLIIIVFSGLRRVFCAAFIFIGFKFILLLSFRVYVQPRSLGTAPAVLLGVTLVAIPKKTIDLKKQIQIEIYQFELLNLIGAQKLKQKETNAKANATKPRRVAADRTPFRFLSFAIWIIVLFNYINLMAFMETKRKNS